MIFFHRILYLVPFMLVLGAKTLAAPSTEDCTVAEPSDDFSVGERNILFSCDAHTNKMSVL